MNLAEFVKQTYDGTEYQVRPLIYCKDGFNLSVQGSTSHYCSPREESDFFFEMEVGFPSAEEQSLMPYAETPSKPTETVYGYVPVEIIQTVIDAHGGIDVAKTLNEEVA